MTFNTITRITALSVFIAMSSLSAGVRAQSLLPRDSFVDRRNDDRTMPLSEAVSMVQGRFNATAVKTDTVMEDGQLVYRIRLLSADKSRVFTVTVDARTGRIN